MRPEVPVSQRALVTAVVAGLTAFAGYFLLATATIELTSNGRNHATVWPADAIVLALLLKCPRRMWPAILLAGWLGNFCANGVSRGWMAGIILYGAINMAQTLLAAHLFTRAQPDRDPLENLRATLFFFVIAGGLAPAFGAAAGSLVSWFNYGQPFGPSYLRWYSSNALGLLIAAPFLKAVLDGSYRRCFRDRTLISRIEATALVLAHIALAGAVFSQSALPLLFLPISTLLLLSFRLGRLGAMVGVIVVAVAGALAAWADTGPMVLIHRGPVFEAIFFQGYLAVILCTAVPVASVVSSLGATLTRLREHKQALQQILAHSPDGILAFDPSGLCRWADGRLEENLGIRPVEAIGRSAAEIAKRTCPELAELVPGRSVHAPEPVVRELVPLLRPGVTLEASLGVLRTDGAHEGVVLTLRDISVRKRREVAISAMAVTDDLTGLLNRKGFRARLSEALEDVPGAASLALIDVDHFKSINDRFGHGTGDQVLAEIARRLTAGTRELDLVGRLGGDEFAILFHCDTATAVLACERIAASLRASAVARAGNVRVMASISCGIAGLVPDMSRGQLMDAADRALYEVKRAGRNGVRTAA